MRAVENQPGNLQQRVTETKCTRWTRAVKSGGHYGVFAQRNPVPRPRYKGVCVSRSDVRRALISLPHEPPRTTLNVPFDGPVGFFDGPVLK